MKDSRIGEALWKEWTGNGYDTIEKDSITFFTNSYIDITVDVVRRALASAIQRDGITSSLREAFELLDRAHIRFGYAGIVDGDREYTKCSPYGETHKGDIVEKVIPVTFVEIRQWQ